MDQPNPLLNSFTYLNEEKKAEKDEEMKETTKNPQQLDTLIVDDNEESPNDEGTEISCEARDCKHNVASFCGRADIQILIDDGEAMCNNYDPLTNPEENDNE